MGDFSRACLAVAVILMLTSAPIEARCPWASPYPALPTSLHEGRLSKTTARKKKFNVVNVVLLLEACSTVGSSQHDELNPTTYRVHRIKQSLCSIAP